jgi:uncharacterized protein
MRLNLQDLAKKSEKTQTLVNLSERLPSHLCEPCTVSVNFHVQKQDDYFLLHLETQADLNIICQRCSQEFQRPFKNDTLLAICNNDARAESLGVLYECVVADKGELELETVITDELYLYSPQFHQEIEDCDKIIHQFMVEPALN